MNDHVKKLLRECWLDMASQPFLASAYYFNIIRRLAARQALPLISAAIVTAIADKTIANEWQSLIAMLAGVYIFIAVSMQMFRWADNLLRTRIDVVRLERYSRIALQAPYHLHVSHPSGDLLAKVRAKAMFFGQQYMNMSIEIPLMFINMAITFGVVHSRSAPISWVYLALWAPSIALFYRVSKKRIAVNKSANEAIDEFDGILADIFANAMTIKQFGFEAQETKSFGKIGRRLYAEYAKRWRAGAIQQNFLFRVEIMLQIAYALASLYLVIKGKIGIGTFVLFQSYVGFAVTDMNSIAGLVRNFQEETVRATSLDELLEKQIVVQKRLKTDARPSRFSIEFRNVKFTYPEAKLVALDNFTLTIPEGQKIGIVGKSGSGKSTLTALLLGLYPIKDGDIYIGDCPLSELDDEIVRQFVSYVPQDPALFNRTIRENILYGVRSLSPKKLNSVINDSYSAEFIKLLPNKIDTLVGNRGFKLSGGQRQRVAIARAIAKNSPIIVFDEATSALDSESEQYIQKAMSNIMANKTAIVIAHRLSTLKYMDRIIVLDEGAVIEDGTHDELLGKDGLYASLWKHQSGGFIKE